MRVDLLETRVDLFETRIDLFESRFDVGESPIDLDFQAKEVVVEIAGMGERVVERLGLQGRLFGRDAGPLELPGVIERVEADGGHDRQGSG